MEVPEGMDGYAVKYRNEDLWVPNISISHIVNLMVFVTVATHQAETMSPKSRSGLKVCDMEKMRR